ncbi:PQQ-binding-like beta-propeller repeat protein [Bremerella cremea]|uniref:PQQ-binding-like beta-propeller repeat protein n=1 Tax=Bremerella cremea TaxID=1031537 RepID=UPI0031E683AD
MVAKPPVEWSEEKNIVWKVEVPGKGSASPVIWGDKLFLLTAVAAEGAEDAKPMEEGPMGPPAGDRDPLQPLNPPGAPPRLGPGDRPGAPGGPQRPEGEARPRGPRGPGQGGPGRGGPGGGRGGFGRGEAPTTPVDFTVICFDKKTGEQLWSQVAIQAVPHESGHNTNTFASGSAVTDGKLLIAFFGSRGVYCYDLDGNLKWKKDLGKQQTRNAFGEGSTPALYEDTLIVPWDHEGDSYVMALDANTGDELWKVPRDEPTTWSTPIVTEFQGTTQVILNGSPMVRSYDVKTGNLIWECSGQAANPIATPIIYDDKAICMTGYRGYAVYSINLDAKGDVSKSDDAIAWSRSDVGPYIASATLLNDRLYVTKSRDGVIYCLDAKTGETIYGPERLPEASTLYSSLVGADGKVYVCDRDGTTVVLDGGPEFKVLATNQLDEGIDASPALIGSQIFIRGDKHLYCIEQAK